MLSRSTEFVCRVICRGQWRLEMVRVVGISGRQVGRRHEKLGRWIRRSRGAKKGLEHVCVHTEFLSLPTFLSALLGGHSCAYPRRTINTPPKYPLKPDLSKPQPAKVLMLVKASTPDVRQIAGPGLVSLNCRRQKHTRLKSLHPLL